MLETLGPALRFWDGCALTAWFICEGPYARTDLAGLAEYHWQELQMLEQWGTPIPPRLFDDLIRAEGRLGPPQPITRQSSTLYSSQGISTTISMNYGSRRNGFEMVRDIITHYRRTWSATYLKTYLRLLWENEIREAGKAYNLLLNKIGKAPTAKKFAKDAEAATNHWFSGDISKLYGAIQEKSPIQPQRASLLPANKMAFAFAVFNNVGGGPLKPSTPHSSENAARARMQEEERYRQFCRLAEWSFLYTQLEEALGHPPEAKDFEAAKRTQIATALNADIEVAWPRYRAAIEQARHMANTQPVMPPTLPDPAVRQSQVFNTVQPSPPANDRPPMAHSQQQEEKRSWIDQWFKSKK